MIKKFKELNESSTTEEPTVKSGKLKLTNKLTCKYTNKFGELMTMALDEDDNIYFNHTDIQTKDEYERLKMMKEYVFDRKEQEFIKSYLKMYNTLITKK